MKHDPVEIGGKVAGKEDKDASDGTPWRGVSGKCGFSGGHQVWTTDITYVWLR